MPLNTPQQLFLDQARSDFGIYNTLAHQDVCHRLHYLQMCTEKLSKVWFWRLMAPPAGGHNTFRPFLRSLDDLARPDFHEMFGYRNAQRFLLQRDRIFDLASSIQNLAPGPFNPNPEYPWPRHLPTDGPLNHPQLLLIWRAWSLSTPGRRLRFFVANMLDHYELYFP